MYNIIFWTGDQNSTNVLAVAEKCLHCIKHFSVSHSIPPASRLEMHKKLGEDTDETRDINWLEVYAMHYDALLSNKIWEKEEEEGKFSLMVLVFPRHC